MARAAIAEQDRFQQCGPVQAVDMVHPHTRAQQCAHGGHMAAFGRGNQGGAAVAVGAAQVGAVGQGQREDVIEAARAGIQVSTVLHRILGVDVGTGLDQFACGIDVVAVGRQQQCGAPFTIARFQIGIVFQRRTHGGGIASRGRIAQARIGRTGRGRTPRHHHCQQAQQQQATQRAGQTRATSDAHLRFSGAAGRRACRPLPCMVEVATCIQK